MKPGESTGELLARITNTMVIIKDSYASYENKPPAPANFDVNNGFTMPICRQWKDDVLNNTQQFLKMQLFRAALTPELRKVVAQRNPNTMTLDDTPATTGATQDQGTTPIETGNTASTANYRTIHRTNVSKEFEKRNRAEIDKEERIGLECI
jgi:hypothetical protein